MSVQIDCPECFRSYQLADKYAGKVVRCQSCKAAISVPDSARSSGENFGTRSAVPRTKKKKKKNQDSSVWKKIGAGLVVCFLVITIIGRGAKLIRGVGRLAGVDPVKALENQIAAGSATSITEGDASVPADPHALYNLSDVASVTLPDFDESQFGHYHSRGIEVFRLKNSFPTKHGKYQGHAMSIEVLMPPGEHAPGSLPCVLIPPAGTPLIHGTPADNDPNYPELSPYVRAGCIAITFSLDGWVLGSTPTDREIVGAYRSFVSSYAGLINTDIAFRFASTKIKEVDSKKILIAGHSSAGTLALLYAAHQPRLAGCIAYAPNPDVEGHVEKMFHDQPAGRRLFPGLDDFAKRSSPKFHVSQIRCPVYLFQAEQDNVIPVEANRQFLADLRKTNQQVKFEEISGTDHYQTMIDPGIPSGIQWMRSRSILTSAPDESLTQGTPAAMANAVDESPFKEVPAEAMTSSPAPAVATNSSMPAPARPSKPDIPEPVESSRVMNPSDLEIGMRVLAHRANDWEGAEVLEIVSARRIRLHFYSLPPAFDKELPISDLRIPVPAKDLDRQQMMTISFELLRSPGNDPLDEEKIEHALLGLEGYLPGSLKLNQQNKKVSLKVIRESSAREHAKLALLRGKCFTGRELIPK